jgi:hypothetical protein
MRFKPKASFTQGFIVHNGPRAYGVGTLAPNPMVFDECNTARRFDEVIGAGFALISVSASGTPVAPAPQSRVLDALGARRVRLCSGEFIPLPLSGTVTAADTHTAFARELRLRGDAFVLVRPDRIVAGICKPEAFPAFEAALSKRLA